MSPISVESGDTTNGAPTPQSDAQTGEWGNSNQGGWIVQKFGGTSVGKLPLNIAEDIVR